eukprot:TRINITY_DN3146_c0_g1_i7.p1 TRINITY_DN3146_c0_g1~~TRINITY_DN3146_c0_g1_i7.p1  ORF type:complete len:202 (+),score=13.91 TRINITY_DN3146_c0_g1_i7:157-762(+)
MLQSNINSLQLPQSSFRGRSGDVYKEPEHEPQDEETQLLADLLDENNLIKKPIPEGPKSLLRSLSDALFFTTTQAETMQEQCFQKVRDLDKWDESEKRSRLARQLKETSIIARDYMTNPSLPGFDNLTLEIVSLIYKVRIVKYSVCDEGYLASIIINNRFDKTIQIVRSRKCHYESVFAKDLLEKAAVCQSIVYDLSLIHI